MINMPTYYAVEAESNRLLHYLFGDKARFLPPNNPPAYDPNRISCEKRNQNNIQEHK